VESETYGAAKAAIVTGGSSGIGLAIARILAAEGYGLTVVARRAERLERAAARLRADGADVQAVTAQVGQEEAVRRVVSAHRQRFGRLDVLVNNAGAGFMAPVSGITTSQLDTQIAVNLRSMVLFYRETVGMLRAAAGEHGSATVFNTSSAVASSPPYLRPDPRLRRHADDRVGAWGCSPGQHASARRHRRGGAVRAARRAGLRRSRT